ncbi:MAG: HAD-IA family hydrolase [Kineosporiaceae bacterium]
MTGRRDVLAETFDAVLFDMDGTLLDSTASVVRSWTRWAGEFGVPLSALTSRSFHGVPARDIVAILLPEGDLEAAHDRIVELEVLDATDCAALPGAVPALAAAAGRAAVVTSCSAPLAAARLAAARLPVPAVVVTADDVMRGKPDPEPFLAAARRLGADPRRCLVVEDAPAGLAAGAAAGCATVAVTTTHGPEDLVADVVVGSLADVVVSVDGGLRLRPA